MDDFSYLNSTKIIFGKQAIHKTADEFIAYGCKRILILYFGEYIEKSEILSSVKDNLDCHGIKWVTYSKLCSNPLVSVVEEAAYFGIKNEVDAVLAIGGGSVIDSAKACAVKIADKSINLNDLILGKIKAKLILPIGVILTIAGSGSESSPSMILTVDDRMMKRSYTDDLIRPKFAIMNPELTLSLPQKQMVASGCDILMHTLDRYFSPSKNTLLIDRISEVLLSVTMEAIQTCLRKPDDYDAHATLMWAGNISHNGLTGTGKIPDWGPHRLEHELSGKYNIVHGEGLCAIWGGWAKHVYKSYPERFVMFSVNVMHVENDICNQDAVINEGIERLIMFFRNVGMPVSLHELGLSISSEDIDDMTRKALYGSDHIGSFMKLYKDDIEEIYRGAI